MPVPPSATKEPLDRRSETEAGRHGKLLSEPWFREWYDERALASRLSADVDLRKVGLLLERLGLTGDEVIALARDDPGTLRRQLVRYVAEQKKAGKLEAYLVKTFTGLKSFLRYHHVEPNGAFPKLKAAPAESLIDERTPTPSELLTILSHLSHRGKLIALFMSHAGMRPQTLGVYGGEAGLTIGDIPELNLESLTLPPIFLIRIPSTLSKTKAAYHTFGTPRLHDVLLSTLAERRSGGEILTKASPVVAPSTKTRGIARDSVERAKFGHGFLTTKAVTEEVRGGMNAAAPEGTHWRVYCLRAYFSTRLHMASADGKIQPELKESLLGHATIGGRYSVGKKWGPELTESARKQFTAAAEYLESHEKPRAENKEEAIRSFAETLGLTVEQFKARILGTPEPTPARAPATSSKRRAGTQKVVPIGDAERMISAGFTFVSQLGPDRCVLEAPGAG